MSEPSIIILNFDAYRTQFECLGDKRITSATDDSMYACKRVLSGSHMPTSPVKLHRKQQKKIVSSTK